ncbi:MAG: HDOD domain-containing protein [Proteobacteria bacterium]|nr:HDOD domain-containing protein [Pseudomonadota bacterium]MBU1547093.1 HDOD domain-containing protein [Pseudomonadota bacterium]MBU2618357.1 HDOD domain-containing protein [Pseudomonadota bacterium]
MGSDKTLREIFSKVNMSELPAMSDHVEELLRLLNNDDSSAEEIAGVILKDASLTTKLLQVVNSAFYSRSAPITNISRAITTLGLTTLKELAVSLALFEDFIKAGVEKEEISKLLALCFVSASQAKILCKAKKINVQEEEVFICTLLHQLGKLIILVYLPELYRKAQELIDRGYSDEFAAKTVLNDLTFSAVGMEIARFWNFSEKIVLSMGQNPPQPTSKFDSQLYLLNVSAFCNRLTWIICYGSTLELGELLLHYGPIMGLSKKEAFGLVNRSLDVAEAMSDNIIRFGLAKLKIRTKITQKATASR